MFIYGASGHGLVIQDILEKNGIIDFSYIDDFPKPSWGGRDVFDFKDVKLNKSTNLIIGIGNNAIRKKKAASVNVTYMKAIHPNSILAISNDNIGEGTVIMAGAIVNSSATIAEHVIINTSAVIEHECTINRFVHVSPNATLCGNVKVGEGTHIGAGSVILQGVNIGKWSIIGAGAVVLKDIPDFSVAVGNPTKIIKKNNVNEF